MKKKKQTSAFEIRIILRVSFSKKQKKTSLKNTIKNLVDYYDKLIIAFLPRINTTTPANNVCCTSLQ